MLSNRQIAPQRAKGFQWEQHRHLDALLRQWDKEGIQPKRQAELLNQMGYPVDRKHVAKRRQLLGIQQRPEGYIYWREHPEADAFLSRYYGHRKAQWIADRISEMIGVPVPVHKVHLRAQRAGESAHAPDDGVNIADVARILNFDPATVKNAVDSLRLPMTGRGHCRFLMPAAVASLCAVYGVDYPWPSKKERVIGKAVYSKCNLRPAYPRHKATTLVIMGRSKHVRRAYEKDQYIGIVRDKGPGYLLVETLYGVVRVPPSLVYQQAEEVTR